MRYSLSMATRVHRTEFHVQVYTRVVSTGHTMTRIPVRQTRAIVILLPPVSSLRLLQQSKNKETARVRKSISLSSLRKSPAINRQPLFPLFPIWDTFPIMLSLYKWTSLGRCLNVAPCYFPIYLIGMTRYLIHIESFSRIDSPTKERSRRKNESTDDAISSREAVLRARRPRYHLVHYVF